MKFSKKSRYGIRALICLALGDENERVALSTIAERSEVSMQYLEQIFAALRRAGIVRSVKGSQGGYLLNDAPENITVADIVKALDGSYLVENELTDGQHDAVSETIQRLIIDSINKKTEAVFKSLTLADLAQECLSRGRQEYMYFI